MCERQDIYTIYKLCVFRQPARVCVCERERDRHREKEKMCPVAYEDNPLQHAATYCNILQHAATNFSGCVQCAFLTRCIRFILGGSWCFLVFLVIIAHHTRMWVCKHCNTLQHTATHCNTLQHTATHCNTLQHTATHGNARPHMVTHCYTLPHATTQ